MTIKVFKLSSKTNQRYVRIPSYIFKLGLSVDAFYVYAWIQDKPEDWDIAKPEILAKQMAVMGRDRCYKALTELEHKMLFVRGKVRDASGKIINHTRHLHALPVAETQGVVQLPDIPEVDASENITKTMACDEGKPLTENPEVVKPLPENPVTGNPGSILKKQTTELTNTPIGSPNEKNAEEIPDEVVEEKPAIGKRLPDDWQPNEYLLSWASENLILTTEQLKSETENFRDYWFAETGRKATKKDWNAAWRYWVRRPDKFERNRIASIKRSDQRYQSRVTGEALPEFGKREKYPWQENPNSYRNLSADRWINGIQAAKPNGHWPIEKFGPYVDDPDCLMPEEVKQWCLKEYGQKYLNQDRKGK